MTRVRFLTAVLAVVAAGVLASAAPVPKGAGANNPTPDLKVFLDTVGKAVKDEKWPAEADEKILRGSVQSIFDRMLKAAEQKERKLPVEFEKLTKLDVAREFKKTTLEGGFVIADKVQITRAKDCVIFAEGDVQITHASNCVVVGRNVRVTVVENCVVVAGDYIRLNSAVRRDGQDPCVLLAGQWIRTTVMDGTICHVLRPTGLPSPDEGKLGGNRPEPAIRTNRADGVTFLNPQDETGANGPKNCAYLPQKTPIAK